ncbi:hypothetical protein RIF29_34856 [Crotalaria pallida]|uniref:Uncharacterized protein n=1 Tax=Crotalaria pallida TaxID=3830 RepID=A0AAN9HUW1_CROPI
MEMRVSINEVWCGFVAYAISKARASLKCRKTLQQTYKDCFYSVFEDEIHDIILFSPPDRVAIGASGSKDFTLSSPKFYPSPQLRLDLFHRSVAEDLMSRWEHLLSLRFWVGEDCRGLASKRGI